MYRRTTHDDGCNSTYRLRYAPQSVRQQRSEVTMRPTHCKYLNEEKVKQRWWGNSTYRLRYWNVEYSTPSIVYVCIGCNSTYHLRYAPKGARQQRRKATMRSTHHKYLSKAKVKRRWWRNSTYCLRYAPQSVRHQRSKATMRPTHRKCLSEAKVKRRW